MSNNVIEIYHFNMNKAINSGKDLYLIHSEEQEVIQLVEQGLYVKVAEVQTKNLNRALELTNHIESQWQENKDVKALTEKARSTGVGDLCVKDEQVYIVSPSGFSKMPNKLKHMLEILTGKKENKKHTIK